MRLALVLLAAFGLQGCAIVALPIAAQVPLWSTIAVGVAAGGNLAVNALHDCRADNGCKDTPLPP